MNVLWPCEKNAKQYGSVVNLGTELWGKTALKQKCTSMVIHAGTVSPLLHLYSYKKIPLAL